MKKKVFKKPALTNADVEAAIASINKPLRRLKKPLVEETTSYCFGKPAPHFPPEALKKKKGKKKEFMRIKISFFNEAFEELKNSLLDELKDKQYALFEHFVDDEDFSTKEDIRALSAEIRAIKIKLETFKTNILSLAK